MLNPALNFSQPRRESGSSVIWIRRLLVLTTLACLIALFCYRLFFPGYLHPFAIYHDDHYVYLGMPARGFGLLAYLQKYPRPLAHILVDLCGRLGPYWVLAPVFSVSFLNAGLITTYLERRQGSRIDTFSFMVFAALCFSDPYFYLHIKSDPFSVFALAFLLLAFHSWRSYKETSNVAFFAITVVLILALALTKESYFVPLLLYFSIEAVLLAGSRISASALLVWSVLCMVTAIHRDSSLWVIAKQAPDPADTYRTDLTPSSVIHGLTTIGAGVLYPVTIISLSIVLAVLWRYSRRTFSVAAIAILFGVASWLANSALPNHLERQYSCLGILFILSPFLLVIRSIPDTRVWKSGVGAFLLLTLGFSLNAYSHSVRRGGVADWIASQEQAGRNLLASLEQIRHLTQPSDSSLVAGLSRPYNPFRAPEFIAGFLGHERSWTVIVPDSSPESLGDFVRLIHNSNSAGIQQYSHIFTFSEDERLVATSDHPTLGAIRAQFTPSVLTEVDVPNKDSFGSVVFDVAEKPVVFGSNGLARVTLVWKCPWEQVEIRVGAPNGKLFTTGASSGKAVTDDWVVPQMRFYLQDSSWGDATKPDHTIAMIQIQVEKRL